MDIFIFETNVKTSEDVSCVKSLFLAESGIRDWCIDLEDEDKILRIESVDISPRVIENLLRKAGFLCNLWEY